MLIRISLCFILMFGCRRINRKRKIVSYKQACINYLSFSITLLVAYSNSSQRKYHQIKNADFMRHSTASVSSNVTLFHIVFKNFSSKLVAIIQSCIYEIYGRYNLLLLLKTNNQMWLAGA